MYAYIFYVLRILENMYIHMCFCAHIQFVNNRQHRMASYLKMLGPPQILNLHVGTDKVPRLGLYINYIRKQTWKLTLTVLQADLLRFFMLCTPFSRLQIYPNLDFPGLKPQRLRPSCL